MFNERPIENSRLQKALDEVKQVMGRYGFAGACMLVAEDEAAFTYKLHANWSAFRFDPDTPMGFRLRAISDQEGKQTAHKRVEGAMHTVCQLADFGVQTVMWMEDLQQLARDAGIDFEHTPFNGNPPGRIYGAPPT